MITGVSATASTIPQVWPFPSGFTLDVTVSGLSGNAVAPTGTVSIVDTSAGNAVLGTGSLYGAEATFSATTGATTPISSATPAYNPNVFTQADFNGDGKPDLAVVGDYSSSSPAASQSC